MHVSQAAMQSGLLIPAAPLPRVQGGFHWYLTRLFRKSFAGIWIASSTRSLLEELNAQTGPAIVLVNHASWWDPLVALMLARRFMPMRSLLGPMEAEQLRKFSFFRKLGVFGINPDDPASLEAMTAYVRSRFEADPRTVLWITPQGQFADVREPIRLRPGAAAVAARSPSVTVVSVAVEYSFWSDRRPELFLRFARVGGKADSTAGWTREMTAVMQQNADALAGLVIARDYAPFSPIMDASRGRINPLYDLWLRLRGRKGDIDAAVRTMRASVRKPHTDAGL